MRGHAIRLSPARRVQNDFLYFANKAPILPVQRRMRLGAVIDARKACPHHPPWTVLFFKAYALLAQEVPELRRVHIGLPWPHLYEYPASVGMIAVERKTGQGPAVFAGRVKDPASRSLKELVDILRHFHEAPLREIKEFRRVLMFGRLPWPLRRLLMWIGLNIGRQRPNFFGTFALSVYSALGAESLLKPDGGAEDAAVDADVFAEHDDVGILLHGAGKRQIDGFDQRHLRHRSLR